MYISLFLFNLFHLFFFCLISVHFRREGDFDTKGVIHYLGFNAGVCMWTNPARVPSSGVKVTYCGEDGRGDPENILEYFSPVNSYTRSGWCLDLGDYYTLRLTDYTVRQLGSNDRNFLQNFELLVGFVMTMIGVCWAGIIKLIGSRNASHTRCQATKTCHTKQKRGL